MYRRDPRNRPMVRVDARPASQLLAMVLGITAIGFAVTGAAAYVSQGISHGLALGALIASFFCLFAVSATRANPSLSLLIFYGFTALEGIGLAPFIERFTRSGASDIVVNAAMTTGVGMALIGGIVYATSFDFRRLSGIAFGGLIALVMIGLIGMFVQVVHPATYAWATLIIFSLLVFVDFGRVKAGGDGLTPVEMAMQIYLDGINIFIALLEIFGIRTRD